MADRKLNEMPLIEIRESTFELDNMLMKLSGITIDKYSEDTDLIEALLCLGNEIKKIKTFLVID